VAAAVEGNVVWIGDRLANDASGATLSIVFAATERVVGALNAFGCQTSRTVSVSLGSVAVTTGSAGFVGLAMDSAVCAALSDRI